MNNAERILTSITKNKNKNILIHTIPKSHNWLVAEKISPQEWLLTLCNPEGNTAFNIGIVNKSIHLQIWEDITQYTINEKVKYISKLKLYKNFLKQLKIKYNKKHHKKENKNMLYT